MSAGLSFEMAMQQVRATFGRVMLSVVAVAMGVALVVGVQLMNTSVLDSFMDTIDGMIGRAAFTVTAGDGLTFDERVLQDVAKVEGVHLAVPLVRGVAFPDDGSGELLTVHGIDLVNDAAVRVYHRGESENVVEDALEFLNATDSIVLARPFAERRGLAPGMRVPLVTKRGVKEFTVRGVLEPEGLARTLDGRLVVMDLYAAQLVFAEPGQISQIDLLVDPADESKVKHAVAAVLPAGLKIEEPALRKEVRRASLRGFQAMLTAFASLAVVAGFVICLSRLSAVLEARTWEIGLLRAIGLRRRVVFMQLLKESMLLGVCGTAIGLVLGLAIGHFGLPIMASAAAINFHVPVPAASLLLTPWPLVLGVCVGLGASVLAAAIPAARLAAKSPVAALTMRGREMPSQTKRLPAAAAGLTGACAIALIGLQWWTSRPGLGLATTLLIALTICLAGSPLVHVGGRFLGSVWGRAFGPVGELAATHSSEHGRREAMLVATVGLGLGVVYMLGVLAGSFERTLLDRIAARTRADLTITSAYQSGGYLGAPMDEELRQQLLALDAVVAVVGQQRSNVPFGEGEVTLDSYDPDCFTDRRVCEWQLEAGALPRALERVRSGEAALVTGPFARQHGLGPGDELTLQSPTAPRRFRVAGVTRSEIANVAIVSRDEYRRSWSDDASSWLYVALAEGATTEDEQGAIARTFGDRFRLLVQTRQEFVDGLAEQAQRAFSLLYIIDAVVFVIVLIGISDTLAASILDRTRELGILRAIGLSRWRIFVLLMLEGVTLGVLGLVLAVLGGVVLGVYWVDVQFPALVGWALEFHFPALFAAATAVLAALLCFAGAFLPAMRAARLDVAAACRIE